MYICTHFCWPLKGPFGLIAAGGLFGAGVFGDGLGALADGVFCQLSGQQQSNGRLDLSGGDGRAFVVVGQPGGFGGDSLEDVVHEAVHDRHGLAADAGVRMHLFQHFVDVAAVRLLPLPLALLVALAAGRFLSSLFRCFRRVFRWHVC